MSEVKARLVRITHRCVNQATDIYFKDKNSGACWSIAHPQGIVINDDLIEKDRACAVLGMKQWLKQHEEKPITSIESAENFRRDYPEIARNMDEFVASVMKILDQAFHKRGSGSR